MAKKKAVVESELPTAPPNEFEVQTPAYQPAIVHNCGMLNVRVEPRMYSEVISVIKSGTIVDMSMIFDQKGWVKIKAGNIEGYVVVDYLKEI